MFGALDNGLPGAPKGLWWCSLWLWQVPLAVFALVPLGVAYWYSHGESADYRAPRRHRMSLAALVGLLICAGLAGVAWWTEPGLDWPSSLWARLCWAASATTGFALLWYLAATVVTQARQTQLPMVTALQRRWQGDTPTGADQVRRTPVAHPAAHRCAGRVAGARCAGHGGHTGLHHLHAVEPGLPGPARQRFRGPGVGRAHAGHAKQRERDRRLDERLPLDTLALVAGVLLWLMVAVAWDVFLLKPEAGTA